MKKVTTVPLNDRFCLTKWSLFLLILVLLQSCGEDIEGCLDPNASNFQADADVSCCCEFPQLKLQIQHKVGENNYSALSTYLDAIDSPFVLSSTRLYLSDFELIKTDGSIVQVEDSVELTLKDTGGDFFQLTVVDDVVLIKNTTFTYDVGTLNATGTLSKIRFVAGVGLPENGALASDFEDTHPLAVGTDSLFISQEDGYIFSQYAVVTDTAANTQKSFEVSGFNNAVVIELDYTAAIERGTDLTLGLDIDYAKIFEGVRFSQDDDLSIVSKVISNTNAAFSVSE